MGENRRALIIANYDYQSSALRRLTSPSRDAEELARVLGDASIGGFEIKPLINESASNVSHAIEEFFVFSTPHASDLLLLYFSGHGVTDEDGQLYLATNDTQLVGHRVRRSTAISADFIDVTMRRSRCRRQVLILDCCHSGAFASGMRMKNASRGMEVHFQGNGRVVLTASTGRQFSLEDSSDTGVGPSLYTRCLIDGLETGKADLDSDSWVEIDELHEYLVERLRADTAQQTPTKSGYVEGQLYIARSPLVKASVLPFELLNALRSHDISTRRGVVLELDELLQGDNPEVALAAEELLTLLGNSDDSPKVRQDTVTALEGYRRKRASRSADIGITREPIVWGPDENILKEARIAEEQKTLDAQRADVDRGRTSEEGETPSLEVRSPASLRTTFRENGFFPQGYKFYQNEYVWFSRDSTLIFSGFGYYGRVWRPSNGEEIAAFNIRGSVVDAAFLPDGRHIITIDKQSVLAMWKIGRDEAISSKKIILVGFARIVRFASDCSRILTTSGANEAVLFDCSSGKHLLTLQHNGLVNFSFSPDGQRILTVGEDNEARVWSASKGELTATLKHRGAVTSCAFSSDSKRAVTTSADHTARVWDVEQGRQMMVLERGGGFRSASFFPDGTRILTVSDAAIADMCDSQTGVSLGVFMHEGKISSAKISPDGSYVLITANRTATVWAAKNCRNLVSLQSRAGLEHVAISPDSRLIATISDDKTVSVWNCDWYTVNP